MTAWLCLIYYVLIIYWHYTAVILSIVMLCRYVDFVNENKYVQVVFIPYLYMCIVVGYPIITMGVLGYN